MKEVLLRKYLEAKLEVQETLEAHPRIHQVMMRTGRLLRGDLGPALEREEGQGFVEYIVLLGGVFLAAGVILGIFLALKRKGQDAANAVNGIQVESPQP